MWENFVENLKSILICKNISANTKQKFRMTANEDKRGILKEYLGNISIEKSEKLKNRFHLLKVWEWRTDEKWQKFAVGC